MSRNCSEHRSDHQAVAENAVPQERNAGSYVGPKTVREDNAAEFANGPS
jgi:hypothetical protein